VQKIAQNVAQTFFDKFNDKAFSGTKLAKKLRSLVCKLDKIA
jgi:hypothetical protein